jgi:hypothetical protein
LETSRNSSRGLPAARIAVDAARDRPFGEHGGAGFEVARLPVLGQHVFVGVVLDQRACRILEIPEQRRRDRMTAGTELRLPAAARQMQAAADHLMHVAHREGHMIEAALGLGRLQQEEIMVAAPRRAAQEMTAAGIAVGQTKTERLIERGGLGQRIGEEDDVTHFDRLSALVDGGRLVDPCSVAPDIGRRA